jgi:hypothetical protein
MRWDTWPIVRWWHLPFHGKHYCGGAKISTVSERVAWCNSLLVLPNKISSQSFPVLLKYYSSGSFQSSLILYLRALAFVHSTTVDLVSCGRQGWSLCWLSLVWGLASPSMSKRLVSALLVAVMVFSLQLEWEVEWCLGLALLFQFFVWVLVLIVLVLVWFSVN